VLYSQTDASKYRTAIEKAIKYLNRMQSGENEVDALGGYYLAELDLKVGKYTLKRLYSWVTMFAIHALNLTSDLSNRKVTGDELW
jgi:hypothetical protein